MPAERGVGGGGTGLLDAAPARALQGRGLGAAGPARPLPRCACAEPGPERVYSWRLRTAGGAVPFSGSGTIERRAGGASLGGAGGVSVVCGRRCHGARARSGPAGCGGVAGGPARPCPAGVPTRYTPGYGPAGGWRPGLGPSLCPRHGLGVPAAPEPGVEAAVNSRFPAQ